MTVPRHCSANPTPSDRRFGCNSRDKNGLNGAETAPFASYNAVPFTASGSVRRASRPVRVFADRSLLRAPRGRGTRTSTLGIGDDCALLEPRSGKLLAISTDMLVEGRHFFPTSRPTRSVTRRSRSICPTSPRWAPRRARSRSRARCRADAAWLDAFSRGLFALADRSAAS
jgi:hypothetical protein